MRETAVDEMFAEFEADALTSFRPPGVPAAQRRVRDRRRRRRRLLAGVGALLLAGPAGAFVAAGRDADPGPLIPTPAPSVSPTPTGQLPERRVILPGAPGELTKLRFVDARHGWVLFDTCDPGDPDATGCRRTVGRTTDGGATWQPTARLADTEGLASLLPVDDRTLTVMVGGGYIVTTDGGAAWSHHPFSAPPPSTATRSGFLVRCPGGPGLGDDATGRKCRLARVGSGPVQSQPPVTLTRENTDQRLVEGGDGRLWLTVRDRDRLTVLVSTDEAATWRKLPAVTGAGRLLVSPDGADAWLVSVQEDGFDVKATKQVWRLVGSRWEQRPGLPDSTSDVAAANGGVLAVTGAYGSAGFWAGGRYVDVPELSAALRYGTDESPSVEVLRDDTVVVSTGAAQITGVGSGVARTWTRIS
ncbi:hypothetical protein [Micromonospora peucetia]|uniref:Uncharacterized protein n=1 Tax=Micromonospora peucetia TaxID=47871 RepID=A0A1C6UVK1_9ACTN|nr:hypothetical protein [Micromonospora peucetia]SCL58114.1 hypothetical protein GA0070608_1931 [Micromonospora peucetia]